MQVVKFMTILGVYEDGARVMKTVFVLGAGASRAAGAPLMDDFLDRAQDLLRTEPSKIDASTFQIVFEALSDLQCIRQKSSLELENVEAVLSAVEMGNLIGKLPGRKPHEIAALRDALVRVIVQTIERTMRFPVNGKLFSPPGDYARFVELVKQIREPEKPNLKRYVSILTFNYDVGLDYALHHLLGIKVATRSKSRKYGKERRSSCLRPRISS